MNHPPRHPDRAIVAFLRGVNVGGHKKISMADLKKAFASMGFKNVRTVLASGNVVFEAQGKDRALADTIAAALGKVLGAPVGVVLRTIDELRKMIESNPFRGVAPGPDVKMYVTFLADHRPKGSRREKAPADEALRIVRVTPGEVFSAVTLTPAARTTDLMAYLEKTSGEAVTTRNWNTILKIIA